MSFWQDKRVMVTGANGFIGRHLCRTLVRSGAEVLRVDRERCQGWYKEMDLVENAPCAWMWQDEIQISFHLAGAPGVSYCDKEPCLAFAANVQAAEHMLGAAKFGNKLKALVMVSSNHVYGEQTIKPTPEDAPLNGRGTYAATKIAADVMAQCYGKTHGLPVGIARITNSYGPDDHHAEHLITSTIKAALAGVANFPMYPNNSKGYLYIADTVSGLMALAEGIADGRAGYGEAFNIVPDDALAAWQVTEAIFECLDTFASDIDKSKPPTEYEHLSNAKARDVLGWRPKYTLSEGLAETIAWYREQHEAKVNA